MIPAIAYVLRVRFDSVEFAGVLCTMGGLASAHRGE